MSLVVEPGTTLALVGPSGSGKSTIVNLLQRYYSLSEGSIELDGVDIATLNLAWLRDQMGLVGQTPELFAESVAANIANGTVSGAPPPSHAQIEAAARAAQAHDFIQRLPLGYDTLVGERGAQLSGGEKQRVSIARAIVRNPPILLLDEATSALDTASEREVQKSIDSLLESGQRRTAIIIAHRLSTVVKADKIVVLRDGEIVQQGTHAELLRQEEGVYRHLWMLQQLHYEEAPAGSGEPEVPVPEVTSALPVAIEEPSIDTLEQEAEEAVLSEAEEHATSATAGPPDAAEEAALHPSPVPPSAAAGDPKPATSADVRQAEMAMAVSGDPNPIPVTIALESPSLVTARRNGSFSGGKALAKLAGGLKAIFTRCCRRLRRRRREGAAGSEAPPNQYYDQPPVAFKRVFVYQRPDFYLLCLALLVAAGSGAVGCVCVQMHISVVAT